MSFELFWEPKGVVIRFSGVVERSDAERATGAYQGDSRFDELAFVIADYSGISSCHATPHDMDMVAAMDIGAARTNPDFRKAVVTMRPEVIALAEHYRTGLQSPVSTAIFPTVEEARVWCCGSDRKR